MNTPKLQEIIRLASDEIRNETIRRTGVITHQAHGSDKLRIAGVPLIADYRIGSVDLTDVPRLLYRNDEADVNAIFYAASSIVTSPMRKGDVKDSLATLRRLYPDVPFEPPAGTSILGAVIQALYVTTWHGAELVLNPNGWFYRCPAGSMLVERQSVTINKAYRRLPHPVGFTPELALRLFVGRHRVMPAKVGKVWAAASGDLPEFTDGLDVLAALAVDLGYEATKVLGGCLDVWQDHTEVTKGADTSHYDRALACLVSAAQFPYNEVRNHLEHILGRERFVEAFGVPSKWADRTYTKAMCTFHRGVILGMKKDAIGATKTHSEANDLLNTMEALR